MPIVEGKYRRVMTICSWVKVKVMNICTCLKLNINTRIDDNLLVRKVEGNEYLHVLKVQRKYSGVMTICTWVKLNVNTQG